MPGRSEPFTDARIRSRTSRHRTLVPGGSPSSSNTCRSCACMPSSECALFSEHPAGARCGQAAQNASGASTTSTRSEEHTSELQSLAYLVCRLLLEKKKNNTNHLINQADIIDELESFITIIYRHIVAYTHAASPRSPTDTTARGNLGLRA